MSGGLSLDRLEKAHYPFKRYPKTRCETVLFPGCAFPSQFPQAMDRLADICSRNGIGIAYDCCGVSLKPYKGGADASASPVCAPTAITTCASIWMWR